MKSIPRDGGRCLWSYGGKGEFKIVDITVGDEKWSVDIARRTVDDGHPLWAWDYTVSHALVGTGVHAAQWPTWERALEEALAYITRKRPEAHDS